MKRLPNRLSDLIDLAVKDSEKANAMKSRILNMEVFHTPLNGKCSMCMAGAVMDRTLGANPKKELVPEHFDGPTRVALINIDRARQGIPPVGVYEVHPALRMIKDKVSTRTGRAPWAVYRKAAKMLREDGL